MDTRLFRSLNFEILTQLNSNQFGNNKHYLKLKDSLPK